MSIMHAYESNPMRLTTSLEPNLGGDKSRGYQMLDNLRWEERVWVETAELGELRERGNEET